MRFTVASFLAVWRRHVRYVLIPILGGLVVVGLLGILSLRWFRQRELAGIMRQKVETASRGFDTFFAPIVKSFDLLSELGYQGILDLEDREELDLLLAALMKTQTPHFNQAIVAASDGRVYEYPRSLGSEDPGDIGGAEEQTMADLEQRPWFQGAMETSTPDVVHWTDPYTFRTTGIPGITGSRRFHVKGKEQSTFVVALKIGLEELKVAVGELGISEDSKLLMISQDEVLDFGRLLDADSGTASVESVMTEAVAAVRTTDEPSRLRNRGGTWWAAARQSTATRVPTNIALVVPESYLREQAGAAFYFLLAGYLLVLAGATLAVFLLSRRSHQVLESFAKLPHHIDDSEEQIKALIRSGENETLEFKSTLRWNLKINKPDKNIELACLKTMVAFMNTDGGTLLVGVADDGTASGIEADRFPNEDRFLLHLNNLMKEHIGLEFSEFIAFAIKRIDDHSILVVDCSRSSGPVFLHHDSEEEFYIRVGPGSRKLPTSKALDYIRAR